jgi:hypothetical protein
VAIPNTGLLIFLREFGMPTNVACLFNTGIQIYLARTETVVKLIPKEKISSENNLSAIFLSLHIDWGHAVA